MKSLNRLQAVITILGTISRLSRHWKKSYGIFYTEYIKYCTKGVQDAFVNIGKKLGINLSAKLDLFYDQKPGKNLNRYFLDGKQISREEFWDIINAGFDEAK